MIQDVPRRRQSLSPFRILTQWRARAVAGLAGARRPSQRLRPSARPHDIGNGLVVRPRLGGLGRWPNKPGTLPAEAGERKVRTAGDAAWPRMPWAQNRSQRAFGGRLAKGTVDRRHNSGQGPVRGKPAFADLRRGAVTPVPTTVVPSTLRERADARICHPRLRTKGCACRAPASEPAGPRRVGAPPRSGRLARARHGASSAGRHRPRRRRPSDRRAAAAASGR